MARVALAFEARAADLGGIRRFTLETLARSGLAALIDDALIVVSELVTNVVEHAHTSGRVALSPYLEGVRIEVEDGSAEPPVLRYPRPDRADGHGLSIVEDLADNWGWAARPGGKAVWADLVLEGGLPLTTER